MENKIKFSVLMSVYKNDNPIHLKEAIESIYNKQTIKPNQVVIVEDGPLTEELILVLDYFKQEYGDVFDLIKLNENVGLGLALQKGIEYCKYKYIARMDSDDISCSDRFLKQIEYMAKYPEIDVLGTYILEFKENIAENETRIRKVPLENDEIKRMAKKRNPMNHVSVIFKKQSVLECGGYNSINLLEDYYLWINMLSKGKVLKNLDESLVYVRTGNGFNHRRSDRSRIIGWKKIQKILLDNKMINIFEAILNMICIFIFTNLPNNIKSILYEKILRKRNLQNN